MKKIYTLAISFIFLSCTLNAQVTGFFELTVTDLPGSGSTNTNKAVVQMRAISSVVPQISECDGGGAFVTNILAGLTWGIKWPLSSGITEISRSTSGNTPGECPDIDPASGYGIANGGPSQPSPDGNFKVRPFLANITPCPIPIDWIGNQWITICTITITGGNCSVCEDLDIYVLGEYPSLEGIMDINPIFAFDDDGSNLISYEATPNNGPLPLDLIAFEAEKYETQDAKLSWVTANEENTSHFSVQRSFDKKLWTELGTVEAAGYSVEIRNYSFMDEKVYNGRDSRLPVYYRLNMVDLDGKQRFSPIESVIFGNSLTKGNEFSLYPNPASEGVQVEWDVDEADQPTALEFYDIAGKLIYTHNVGVKATAEYVDFNQTQIHAGVYMVRIMSGETPISHQQLVVGKN